jgi:hypothetical protein
VPLISREHGFLFVMAPRTGCTAVGKVLCEQLGAQEIPNEPVGGLSRVKHATLDDLLKYGVLDRADVAPLLTFTTVRNPFDSLVSLYAKQRWEYADVEHEFFERVPGYSDSIKMAAQVEFPDWIRWRFGPRSWKARARRWIPGSDVGRHLYESYLHGVEVVMRFESLQADFDAVMERLQLPPITVPEYNVTSSRSREYRPYYDRRSRRLVEQRFAPDLERFGYEF